MKTKSKKYGIAVALVLLILSVSLISGCTGPESGGGGYTPPAGMGAIRLSVRTPNGRTIMPETAVGDFTAFELDFTTGDGVARTVNRLKADLGDFINLTPGHYDLIVTAYLDADPDLTSLALPAAQGTVTGINVSAGSTANSSPIIVTLYPFTDGEEEGTFSWAITLEGGLTLTVAEMEIQDLAGNNVAGPFDLMDGTAPDAYIASYPLDSGYYRVVFTLTDNKTPTPNTITWRQILHIYQNITTSFAYEFKLAHFIPSVQKYRITFDFMGAVNAKNVAYTDQYQDVLAGDPIGTLFAPNQDFYQNHDLEEWNSQNDFDGAAYDGSEIPTEDITLYAKWQQVEYGSADDFEVEFDIEDITLEDDDNNITSIEQGDEIPLAIATTGSITINVIKPTNVTLTSANWYLEDTYGATFATGLQATISAGTAPFNVRGTYKVIIEALVSGVPLYETYIYIKITDN